MSARDDDFGTGGGVSLQPSEWSGGARTRGRPSLVPSSEREIFDAAVDEIAEDIAEHDPPHPTPWRVDTIESAIVKGKRVHACGVFDRNGALIFVTTSELQARLVARAANNPFALADWRVHRGQRPSEVSHA